MLDADWIMKAVELIREGVASRVEKDGVIAYRCGKIIRVDIKEEKI